MVIDILVLLVVAAAIFKGYRIGLIVAVLQFVAVIIAAAAALKLGTLAATYLQEHFDVGSRYAPLLGFVLVFMLFMIGIRLLAVLLTKSSKLVMLGWLNSLGGVIFYVLLNLVLVSIALFYLTKMSVLPQEQINNSQTYPILAPLAPWIMEGIGTLIPIFKDLFNDIEGYFGEIAPAASTA